MGLMETNNNMKDFNIAEILKYAPKGLKLYSPLLGEVRLEKVSDHDDTIVVTTKYKSERVFFEDGKYDSNGECLLFPSINHRCWNNWQNTLFLESIGSVCVDTITGYKYILENNGTFFSDGPGSGYSVIIENDESNFFLNSRYATPEETKEFFEELDKNGYMWNGKMVVEKEQNKPKFHEGDWITDGKALLHITKFEIDYGYELKAIDGEVFHFVSPDLVNANYRLWTIRDAKDGDVLVTPPIKGSENNVQIFIFKGINNRDYVDNCIEYYCRVCNGVFYENKTGFMGTTSSTFYPATKGQRDFLFQKMKEEGYKWDVDAKKLIKTTTPIPKFKFGDIIKHKDTGVINSIKYVCSDYYVLDNNQALFFESQDMWELAASKANLSLEEKVSILVDEIIDLKERVKSLELQVIKQCSDKIRLDSLESKMIMIEMKLSALEYGSTPLTLIQNPFLYSGKVTCDDAQCYKGKSASDTFETPDKAGDNVTLEEMKG